MTGHPLEALSALLDDELPPAERAAVEAHVAACASCARHLRELGAVDELARGLPPAGAPDGYLEALPGRVRRRIRADRPARARASWVLPLAAGLALAVLTPMVLQQRRESAPPERPAVALEQPPAAATARQAPPATADERLASAAEGAPAPRPQARAGALRRETAPAAPPPATTAPAAAQARDAFAPPPAGYTQENARLAERANAAEAQVAAGAPAAAPAEAELKVDRDEGRTDAPKAVGGRIGAASSLKKEKDDAGRKRAGEEEAFLEASSLPVDGPEQARRVREAWRRFVSLHPAGPRADEGRVRWIESAVAVFRLTRDPDDRAIAEREGRAYLAVPGAPQAARVREALGGLDGVR